MKMIITKEMLEDDLKIKIDSFKLEPLYKNDVCIGLKVFIIENRPIEHIEVSFKITESKQL